MPCYNRADYVGRAIDSILQQTQPADEIIVVDDGSIDQTRSFLNSYQDKICVIQHCNNQGVSAARNSGIRAARYPWIALLDSDDCWHSQKLARQVAALQQNLQYRICHTNELWYRNGRRVNEMKKHTKYGGNIFNRCLSHCLISPSSVLLHRQLFDELGFFDTSLPACEDYDLWLRITAQYPVLYLEDRLTIKHGGHCDQLSQKHWGMDRFRIQALRKLLKHTPLTPPQYHAAAAMLKQKINIYLIGARKRNKQDEIACYERYLDEINRITKRLKYSKGSLILDV